jgi:dihydrodipicolinate synthase/N-acetylneuraminate lyase
MDVRSRLREGLVIPAHPLALTSRRKLDERHQRALTRYYIASGAGGIAVGVHTTQFAIRDPKFGLLRPVLELAMDELRGSSVLKIAGVCGLSEQALGEAELAAVMGYDAVLLSLGALADASVADLIAHVRAVASVIPVIGFYLQPAVGGRILPFEFWAQLAEIDRLVAIKVAPFNRYQTLDVVRAVAGAGRTSEISLYTGNDDNILIDLLSEFSVDGQMVRMSGGLLGHWAVWTSIAVSQLTRIQNTIRSSADIPAEMLTLSWQVTDSNAALFDPAHGFRGCVAGIHEVLRRQGLLNGRWCLDPEEDLSAGQMEEIDRVCRIYPHLQDDEFVRAHLDEWLR